MILTCPECKTQFAVPSTAIGSKGRKVKCSSCKHVWHQKPLEEIVDISKIDKEPKNVKEIPKNSGLPAVTNPPENTNFYKKISFALLLLITIFVAITANRGLVLEVRPELVKFYDAIGMQVTDGLILSDFIIDKKMVGNEIEFNITGSIENESVYDLEIPNLVINILTKSGKIIKTFDYKPEQSYIESHDKVVLKAKLEDIADNAERIVVDLGNSWEHIFR